MKILLLRLALIILFITAVPLAGFSFDLEGASFIGGNAIILNAEPVEISPAPGVWTGFSGVSVPMLFTNIFFFEPGLRLYGTRVILAETDLGLYKAVPAALETENRMWVLNIDIRPELGVQFRPGEKIFLGITAAPAITLRFPLLSYDDASELGHPGIIRQYYFSKVRYLSLYAGAFFGWRFSENNSLIIKAGTNLPVYHLWDEDPAAFYDQLAIMPEIAIRKRF